MSCWTSCASGSPALPSTESRRRSANFEFTAVPAIVYFQKRGEKIAVLLCGRDKSTQDRDISSLRLNGATEMAEKLYDYDPADALKSDEAIEVFLSDAFETGEARYIAKALGVVARAKGMTKIARETGLAREQLYKSLRV